MSKEWLKGHFNFHSMKALNLTAEDMLIIDWFYAFYLSKKMVHKDFHNPTTQKIETFFWVKYQGVLDDLEGNIAIKSKKSMARRFKKYCTCGLMFFHLERRRFGTYTYYHFNENVLAQLLKNNSVKDLTPSDKTVQLAETKIVQTPKDSSVLLSEASVVQSPLDNAGQPKDYIANKRKATTAETNHNVSPVISLTQKIDNLFGSSRAFEPDYIKKLDNSLNEKKLGHDEKLKYLDFVYEHVQKKANKSEIGYFYKVSLTESFFSQFDSIRKKDEEKKITNKINCPACGQVIQRFEDCPYCYLYCSDRENEEKIKTHHNYFLLPKNKKDEYKNEKAKIYNKYQLTDLKEKNTALKALEKKFNI